MKRIVLAVLVGLWAAEAGAQASTQLAFQLGDVIGSEAACGLTYDQAAIERFIEEHVAADDMGFAGDVNLSAGVMETSIEEMGASQRTAHCAQMRRVAKSYGFVQ